MLRLILVILVPNLAFLAARLGLPALSLTALRDIPPSAYQTIPWFSYIPYV